MRDRNAPRPVYLLGTEARGRAGRVERERAKGVVEVEERRADEMGIRLSEVRRADMVDGTVDADLMSLVRGIASELDVRSGEQRTEGEIAGGQLT